MTIKFFKTPANWRKWLEKNHATIPELWVGFYKLGSGLASITWPESVDQALCFGWIDGIRKSVDELSYTIRFTPRRPGSVWSAININRAQNLIELGLMMPAGLEAFRLRKENRSGIYSYEQRSADLPFEYSSRIIRNKRAWKFYVAQPPSYRKVVNWWVVSAKKDETRLKRLAKLIEASAKGRRL